MCLNPDVEFYLDIDEVVTDFCKQAEIMGYKKPIEAGKFCNDPELWEIINKDALNFAATMPWKQKGKILYEILIRYNRPIIPITHCPSEEWKMGRLSWIEQNLTHSQTPIIVPSGSSKATFCKGENSVLIDDIVSNVEEWRVKGGTAILWDWKYPIGSHVLLDLALENLRVA